MRHRADGRAIRVFRGAGGQVTYLGEFALDEDQPYFRMEAPESETGLPRQVIVFRLAPIGPVIPDVRDELDLPDEITAPELDAIISGEANEAVVIRVPVEQQNVEQVEVPSPNDGLVYGQARRETLVLAYSRFLEGKGLVV